MVWIDPAEKASRLTRHRPQKIAAVAWGVHNRVISFWKFNEIIALYYVDFIN